MRAVPFIQVQWRIHDLSKVLRGPEIYGRASGDRLEARATGTPDTPRFFFWGGDTFIKVYSSYTRQNIRTINNKKNDLTFLFSRSCLSQKGDRPLKIRH